MSLGGQIDTWSSQFTKAGLTSGLVLVASLVNYLSFQRYPLLTPEVAILLVSIVALTTTVSAVYASAPALIRVALEILLLVIAVGANVKGWWILIALAIVPPLFNKHLMTLMGTVAAAVLASSIVFSATFLPDDSLAIGERTISRSNTDLPPLLHVILDEHIGIEGLRYSPEAMELGREIQSLYQSAGFRIYGGAHSNFWLTQDSIPSLLNFGEAQPWINGQRPVPKNRYFDYLRTKGYAITVYQSPFIDYCVSPAVSRCWTYPKGLLSSLRAKIIPVLDRAVFLGRELAYVNPIVRAVSKEFNIPREYPPYPAPATFVLDRLAAEVGQLEPGTALFVHVLVPHSPYMLDRFCNLKNMTTWVDTRDIAGDRDRWKLVTDAYHEQLRCLLMKMKSVIEAADERAIIIVHGDHGSRIADPLPAPETVGRTTMADFVASYATLFGVRAPGLSPTYEKGSIPVAHLLDSLTKNDFRAVSGTPAASLDRTVFLISLPPQSVRGKVTSSIPYHLPEDWLSIGSGPSVTSGVQD